jgi:hypothetical protein
VVVLGYLQLQAVDLFPELGVLKFLALQLLLDGREFLVEDCVYLYLLFFFVLQQFEVLAVPVPPVLSAVVVLPVGQHHRVLRVVL